MSLQQEAYEKIMRLPDDRIRLIIALADEMIRQMSVLRQEELSKKHQAYEAMMEMKKVSTYPKDFDYHKEMEDALLEKYGHIA